MAESVELKQSHRVDGPTTMVVSPIKALSPVEARLVEPLAGKTGTQKRKSLNRSKSKPRQFEKYIILKF